MGKVENIGVSVYSPKRAIQALKMDGIDFINSLAKMAEERGHHPDLVVRYCKVFVEFTSHDLGGVSEECMNMAKYIDSITNVAD